MFTIGDGSDEPEETEDMDLEMAEDPTTEAETAFNEHVMQRVERTRELLGDTCRLQKARGRDEERPPIITYQNDFFA